MGDTRISMAGPLPVSMLTSPLAASLGTPPMSGTSVGRDVGIVSVLTLDALKDMAKDLGWLSNSNNTNNDNK
ncbi:hypothetical protein STCU_11295 [Strigomonas culicis]|uniref:Uncharacterized protein n=1 Tax=Strigomonas culicis TaxID=28005 RepID=S9UNZ9_9TRYP|nr:hypothetical protein STCU_11295 [Strigomonas culicis]|eukprot:EPY16416.1 hypothetical protein STCU_11295 [Strigomonas culicis]